MPESDRSGRARSARPGRDAGAGTIEYLAVILLIAMIVTAFIGTAIPGTVTGYIEAAICRVVNGGSGAACETPQDKAVKPPVCMVTAYTESYGGTIDVAFFQIGKDIAFIRTVGSDGKVTVTAVNGQSLGVGTGAGVGVNWSGFNIGADASVAGNLKIGLGDSWVFGSRQEADAFIDEVRKKAAYEGIKQTSPLGWLGGTIAEAVDPPHVRDPDVERYEVELNGNAGASAGLSLGKADPKGRHRKPDRFGEHDPKSKDQRGSDALTPNLNVYVTVDGQEKAIVERNKKDGSTSVTVSVGGGAKAGANYVVNGKQVRGQVSGTVKLTYDKNGLLSGLTLTRTVIENGEAEVTTTDLAITTEAERRAVYEHLAADYLGDNGIPAATPLKLTWDDMAPVDPPGPDSTDLQRLLYEKGRTAKVDYDYQATDRNYGLSVKLGLKIGLGVALSDREQHASRAQYLGAPGADGKRQWKTFQECHE